LQNVKIPFLLVVHQHHHGFLQLLHDYHLVLVLALVLVLDYLRHGFLDLEVPNCLDAPNCLDCPDALDCLDCLDALEVLQVLQVLVCLVALKVQEVLAGLLDCGSKESDPEEDHHEDHAS
jgi:hypothetical protein